MEKLEIEYVKLTSLKFHPRNYKKHPEDQLAHIQKSITEHGFYRNVVIAKENTILAGHGVVQAAARMGMTEVPCLRLNLDPNEPKALKVVTSDNELGKLGEVDDRALTELLNEIMEKDSLEGTGFDQQMLAALLYTTRPESEISDMTEAQHWAGMPEHQDGQKQERLTILFRSKEDRDRLISQLALKTTAKLGLFSAWWPPDGRDDLKSVKWEQGA